MKFLIHDLDLESHSKAQQSRFSQQITGMFEYDLPSVLFWNERTKIFFCIFFIVFRIVCLGGSFIIISKTRSTVAAVIGLHSLRSSSGKGNTIYGIKQRQHKNCETNETRRYLLF